MWVFAARELYSSYTSHITYSLSHALQTPYDIILLGGLTGRLDQTVHTLSYLHKLRKSGRCIFAVTDDNVGWVLDEAGSLIPRTPETDPLRESTIYLLITQYWDRLAGCSPLEWIPPC
jgi:hypothetical protein